MPRTTSFTLGTQAADSRARTGVISTPHGDIATPAFIPVGTKATVKAVLPESVAQLGAQAVLANAYHLYLQPGHDLIDEAGGLGRFMNWPGPTYTDSGGFQVMSLGAGFKKVLSESFSGNQRATTPSGRDDDVEAGKDRLAHVDDDGVDFRSFIDGSQHRFTPEVSMQIQHGLGADIMFAFDELTTLMNSRRYQEEALERTRLWAQRCLAEHARLTEERQHKPYQQLWGVIQGAQYEDLRRKAARDLGSMEVDGWSFDGFGIGGALEKENLGTIVGWVTDELPDERPRHLLGISEVDDLFVAIAAGADTFDCVSPSRVARNSAVYTRTGRVNLTGAKYRRQFSPIDDTCDCYTCQNYTAAYVHHLFRAKEMLSSTLCTIHNERFVVRLVDEIRESITNGTFAELREERTGQYYGEVR
ncbi:tRNA guanosine(34) transglycosylase Tgt [Helcobacillus massiliensis]|uniref:Queuine tRNA-ribosyltransferase n=1 Tax=Helcobacillus massiliensis TaxID=521392 RepID=A0A839QYY5_9MICO|nr:tRNA guanosine(34) transglycosylase Tgt [Helcobacillus massiliensis]MBB3023171.1 queuine tRNA-ribosyltransferase [Helcobacillus massiliensis]MCT1556652.1 tRNA guanosine(34) transglycosylase Tgt [Helcobacillus massiliensis]MCT2035846.1 tRNA guanosine(34) transglycosylase Tgt [Helcobacillus massiliensis]MCT2331072.1 tRNA guanosine(34) transglycosylase Tgt [Helcobacillus massiliensis]